MKVKEMKEIIKDLPDDTDIILVGWTGRGDTKQFINRCCNIEHQESIGQVWLSNEGLPFPEPAEQGMTGHWHCGEPMEIAGQTPDGFDIFECTLCGEQE